MQQRAGHLEGPRVEAGLFVSNGPLSQEIFFRSVEFQAQIHGEEAVAAGVILLFTERPFGLATGSIATVERR